MRRCKNLLTHKSSHKKHSSSDAKGNNVVEGQFNNRIGLFAFGGTCNFHNLRSWVEFAFASFTTPQDIRRPINEEKVKINHLQICNEIKSFKTRLINNGAMSYNEEKCGAKVHFRVQFMEFETGICVFCKLFLMQTHFTGTNGKRWWKVNLRWFSGFWVNFMGILMVEIYRVVNN